MMLKNLLTSLALAGLALPTLAATAAADAASAPAAKKAPTAQQVRMETCNAQAKEKTLKGDERKAFMKECLSNKPAA